MKKERSSKPSSQGISLCRPTGERERPRTRLRSSLHFVFIFVRNNKQIFPIRIKVKRTKPSFSFCAHATRITVKINGRIPPISKFLKLLTSKKSSLHLERHPRRQLQNSRCRHDSMETLLWLRLRPQRNLKTQLYKQLLDEVFVISRIIKVEVGVISRSEGFVW